MLISTGDYKGFRKLIYVPDVPKPFANPIGEVHLDKLVANFKLLRLLSQPDEPPEKYIDDSLRAIYKSMHLWEAGDSFGSTEVQLVVLCLRLLHYLDLSTRDDVIQEARTAVQEAIQWGDIYQLLLREDRVWDFRDLWVTSVPVFGWQETGKGLLNKSSFPETLHGIMNDWMDNDYDESTTLALLDLFTTSVLQDVFGEVTDQRNLLCLDYAHKVAGVVLKNDPQNTRSRPFIQWILAKAAFQLQKTHVSEWTSHLKGFPGLLLRQGNGIQVPIYVRHPDTDGPNWQTFLKKTAATQEPTLEVALKTARSLGDYDLQSLCLKFLVLQSTEPNRYMNDLATLQLDTQQDKEGFLGTLLSRYLVQEPPLSISSFQQDARQLNQVSGGSYVRHGVNASLLWAKSMIRDALLSDRTAEAESSFATPDRESILREELAIYGPRLPEYTKDYIRSNIGIDVPRPIKPYRPAKIRFSDSTVGGEDVGGSRKRPQKTMSKPDRKEYDTTAYGGDDWPRGERQKLMKRFEVPDQRATRFTTHLPSWLNFSVEGWPSTWRSDAAKLAADAFDRLFDTFDFKEPFEPNIEDPSEKSERDDMASSSKDKEGEAEIEDSDISTEKTHESNFESDKEDFPSITYEEDGWPEFQIPRSFLKRQHHAGDSAKQFGPSQIENIHFERERH